METAPLRKPRNYFDTSTRPVHVTFDDGKHKRRNFPWLHYVEASWDYADRDVIKIFISDLLVLVTGHNLGALYSALEDQSLARVRAQPDLANDREHDADSFVTSIRFLKVPEAVARNGQIELNLGED